MELISRKSFLKVCGVGLAMYAFNSMPMVNAFASNSFDYENAWELYTPDEIFSVMTFSDHETCYNYLVEYKRNNSGCTNEELDDVAKAFYSQLYLVKKQSPAETGLYDDLMNRYEMNPDESALASQYPSDVAAVYSAGNLAKKEAGCSICWASVGMTASRKLSCRSVPSESLPRPAPVGCSCAVPTPSDSSPCPGPGSSPANRPSVASSSLLRSAPVRSGSGTGSRSGASCCTAPGAVASESSGASCRTCPAGSSADAGSGSGEDNPRSAYNSDCCSYLCWLLSLFRRRMVVLTARSTVRRTSRLMSLTAAPSV